MSEEGKMSPCESAGCDWKCCNFGSDGHIILLPEEYESVDLPTSHLSIIADNYMGGKHVKCTAENRVTCDGGYKPIQCRVYPLWIRGDKVVERSMRCPLTDDIIENHIQASLDIIEEYKKAHSFDLDAFLDYADINQYKEIK